MALFGAGLGSALLAFVCNAYFVSGSLEVVPLDDFVAMWAARGSSATAGSSFSGVELGMIVDSLHAYALPCAVIFITGLAFQLFCEFEGRKV